MKQYLSRQLWMLAILLFAGIGNAFGAKVTTNFDGLPNECGQVYYLLPNGGEFWPISGQEWNFDDGSIIKLNVNIVNPVYSISSVTVNNIPVQLTYVGNDAYCNIELSEEEYVVEIESSLDKDNAKTIKVTWDESNVNDIFFDFPTESFSIHPQGSGVENYLPKSPNTLCIATKNPLGYQISVVVDNNDVTQDYLNNNYIYFDDDKDHVVTVSFNEVDSRNITVNWEDNLASVYFSDQNDKIGWAQPETPFKLPKGSSYKMYVDLSEPFKYSVTSVKVGTDDVTSDYNTNGYIVIPADDNNYDVNVTIAEAESTQNITFNWNSNYNVSVSLVDQKGNIQWFASGGQCQAATGANYKVRIHLDNPLIEIQSVKVNNQEVQVTYNSTDKCYEYEIANLSSEVTVDIEFANKPANTVTVTWGDDCAGVNFVDENDNWFNPKSGEPETLLTGSTYKMIIDLDDVWTYRPLVTIAGGSPVAATFNSNEHRYEYEIGTLSQDLDFTISVEERPTRPVTVTWDYSKVKVYFWNSISGDNVNVVSGTACNLTDGIPYRMCVSFPDNDFYNLTSITVNGNDVTGDYIREYRDNGYLAFDAISADYTVSIGINKSVETNTITVDWDADEGNVQFHDTDYNWFYPDREDGECELPTGNTYVMSINLNNSLVYSVGSVTVDQVGVQDYNDYEFSNLSDDHSVAVVFNKVPSKTVTVTWDENNGDVDELCFWDESETHNVWTQRGRATELPEGATSKMEIVPAVGFIVKALKVDNVDVTKDFVDGWYVFENLSDDHIVTIEFGTVETHTITVAYDTDHTNYVVLNDRGVSNNESREFNKGSDVTMRIDCEDGYKPVLTIDGGNDPITLDKNQDGQYKYVFSNLSTDHSVSIAYEAIIYHTITVNTNNDRVSARLNTAQNEYNWIQLGVENKFEEGEDVTLILDIDLGFALNKLMDGETDITEAYKANNYYTFSNLGSDHVVNVTISEVNTYSICANFDEYSQGTVYMESAMMSKRETRCQEFNEGSDVTLFVEPAIGYEVSKIVIRERDTNEEPEEVNFTEEDGLYKFTISGLSKNYVVTITTQKKSMAGIDPIAFTLDETGMCTYCSEYDLDFTNVSGITAYIANGFNSETGSVVMNEVDKVPAGTGLLIKGKPGNYSIPVVETNSYNTNMLTGIVKPKQIPTSEWADIRYANFTLQSSGVFRIANDSYFQLDANKAYLRIPHNLLQNTTSQIKIEWGALKGDVNNDGVVDITDAVIIVNFIVGNNSNF